MTTLTPARRAVWPARIVALASVAVGLGSAVLAAEHEPTAGLAAVIFTGVGATFLAVGILILERRPGNRVGPVLFALGASFGIYILLDAYIRLPERPAFAGAAGWTVGMFDSFWFTFLGLLLLWFPDGRLPSPRWRIVPLTYVVMTAAFSLGHGLGPGPISYYADLVPPLANPIGIPGFPGEAFISAGYFLAAVATSLSAASLVVRWRRAGVVERAQLKWVAFAAPLIPFSINAYYLAFGAGYSQVYDLVVSISVGLFGGAIGVAILRYRLYDIDRLISRTLAYGALTITLAGTYVVGFLVVQAALSPFTGTGGPVAVAASTLGVFVLFQPLRRRLREAMDRRFNRSRYDAQQTIEAFAARLRDEVHLDRLGAELRTVVDTNLAPSSIGVWLSPPQRLADR